MSSTDNTVQVVFGATTEGLERGAKTSSDAVASALASMKESFASVSESVNAMRERVDSAFEGIGGALMKFNVAMSTVRNLISGGEMFKEFVKDAISTTKESLALGKALGITATEASYMKSALVAAGVSQEAVQTAASKITRTLLQNEEAFGHLGVATRDSNGNFLATNEIMNATNERLRSFKEGTDRNVEGMKIYGRSWAEVSTVVNKWNGDTEEGRKTAEALNLVIGTEAVSAMVAYNKSQGAVGEVMEGLKNTIGQAIMPLLTNLANWFASIGPQAVSVMRIVMNGFMIAVNAVVDVLGTMWDVAGEVFGPIGDLIGNVFGQTGTGSVAMKVFQSTVEVVAVGFIGFRIAIQEAGNIIRGILEQVGNAGRLMGSALYAAIHFDWAGVKAAWNQYHDDTIATMQRTVNDAVKIAEKGNADITKALEGKGLDSSKVTPIKKKEGGDTSDGKDDKDKKDESKMGGFKDALRQKIEAEGAMLSDSTMLELKYWQGIQTMTNLSVKDRQAVNTEVFNLTKKALADELAVESAQVDAERSLSKQKFAVKAEEINALKVAGQISDTEALQRLRALHSAEASADQEALRTKLALFQNEAKEREKLMGEIAAAEQKANATMVKDTAAIAKEVQKSWATAFQPITTAFDTAVRGVINGTTTIKKAVQNMGKTILADYVQMGVKSAEHWATTELAKTTATAAGTAERTALEETAAIESVALGAWAAIKNIMNYAWQAMAGAYQAIVAIPYVGPYLAPVAAGIAFGAVAAGVSSIASAEGGYDIPKGVNPITQLHEQEMVLPKEHANAVRDMARGGGRGGGDQFHLHGKPSDSIKLRDFAKMAQKANRQYRFTGK